MTTIAYVAIVALIVGGIAELVVWWAGQDTLITVRKPTAVTHPPQPTDFERDLEPPVEQFHPITHDTTPRGLLTYYSYKTRQAMESSDRPAHVYARLAASLAFSLYPELRPQPLNVVLFPVAPTMTRPVDWKVVH